MGWALSCIRIGSNCKIAGLVCCFYGLLRGPAPRHSKATKLTDEFQDRLARGARNLLLNCAQCQSGDELLVIIESGGTGYYDPNLGPALQDAAKECGMESDLISVPFDSEVHDPDEALMQKMDAADCTVFLARLGDQIRFRPKNSSTTQVISYALDCEMMASPFGVIDYQAFEALKGLINNAVEGSIDIHVTCPAGTDFRGSPAAFSAQGRDTTSKRFPVSVFAPIPAFGFRGRVAQNGFLTGTGSQYYTPWSCALKDTLFVEFEDNHITGFDGTPEDVAAAKAHYDFVGTKYGIDTYYVHSWHAGIHPGCNYPVPAGRDFARWSGGAFGNPRLLHLHTCGAYPPGEISLNLLDTTVRLDGVALWEDGRLYPERIEGGAALLAQHPEMAAVFDTPAPDVGQAASGILEHG